MSSNNPLDIQRLLRDKEALKTVAQSQEAKALAGMLTQRRDQASLRRIAEDAARGDTQELSALVRSIANSPGGAQLLRQLSRSIDKK